MIVRLFLLFTLLPLAELAILFGIADATSWKFTLGLVIVTGVAGAALARHQGLRCWQQFHRRLAEGKLPADEILDGLMILVAATALVTPGVITDTAGFLLLMPPVRRLVRRRLSRRLKARMAVYPFPGDVHGPAGDDGVIDVESRPAGGSHDGEE